MSTGMSWGIRGAVLMLLPLLASCGGQHSPAAPSYADLPPFIGRETDRWLVEESAPVGRDDVLPAFEDSAKEYGCRTDRLNGPTTKNIYGESRTYFGVTAYCYQGTISLITLVGGSVLIGCAKPTTLEACNQLLRDIAQSR